MTDRQLILLRHAKAERPDGYATDAERPLSARGRADARAAGAWLAERGLRPDLVLCSPAVRTRQTWDGVAAALALGPAANPAVDYQSSLYALGAESLLTIIGGTAPEVRTLLVIGHNPTMSVASALLDPEGGAELRTAGLAVHAVPGEWTDCARPAAGGALAPLTEAHTARG